MKKLLLLVLSLVLAMLLTAATNPNKFQGENTFQDAILQLAVSYTSGTWIDVEVVNYGNNDVWFLEQGQCHRFFEVTDRSGTVLTISDPNMACTMEFRTKRVPAQSRVTIDTWDQRAYRQTCPPCTTEPCPLTGTAEYPCSIDGTPTQVPDGEYSIAAWYTTDGNLDMDQAVGTGQTFQITSNADGVFSDVPPTHWAYEHIQYLFDHNIADGYGDGTFKPSWNITKAEMVKMALNAANIPVNTYIQAPSPYKDVTPEHSLVYYIATAQSRGLIEDGDYFYPEQPASRFFTLQLLIDALGDTPDIQKYAAESPAFSDVSGDEERAYTNYAKEQKIVSGYGDGTYGPNNPVTRAEMSKIIHNTLEN